jgi:hypothetical protein
VESRLDVSQMSKNSIVAALVAFLSSATPSYAEIICDDDVIDALKYHFVCDGSEDLCAATHNWQEFENLSDQQIISVSDNCSKKLRPPDNLRLSPILLSEQNRFRHSGSAFLDTMFSCNVLECGWQRALLFAGPPNDKRP